MGTVQQDEVFEIEAANLGIALLWLNDGFEEKEYKFLEIPKTRGGIIKTLSFSKWEKHYINPPLGNLLQSIMKTYNNQVNNKALYFLRIQKIPCYKNI